MNSFENSLEVLCLLFLDNFVACLQHFSRNHSGNFFRNIIKYFIWKFSRSCSRNFLRNFSIKSPRISLGNFLADFSKNSFGFFSEIFPQVGSISLKIPITTFYFSQDSHAKVISDTSGDLKIFYIFITNHWCENISRNVFLIPCNSPMKFFSVSACED